MICWSLREISNYIWRTNWIVIEARLNNDKEWGGAVARDPVHCVVRHGISMPLWLLPFPKVLMIIYKRYIFDYTINHGILIEIWIKFLLYYFNMLFCFLDFLYSYQLTVVTGHLICQLISKELHIFVNVSEYVSDI